ncbi:LysR family transcriptional regulator [Dryocola clanedunensis]|uniref:LysR family transcriptional regulator n=1 Tax=Cedecea sulfonylureivorans TaxID=3051154 RepID=UPI001926E4CA|nr:LysR family transcriptional regulator [Cedecea sulfonylureivorans]
MHLHKLIYQFKVLADKKTFTAAAEKLCISQPTLTQNIQRLESALEVSLVIREGKGLSLTLYGERLYQHGCLLDRSYRQAMQDIDILKRSHRQTLVLECGHAWSHGVLFSLMQSYVQSYPDIRMVIRNSNSTLGQQHLLKGECDLALGAIPPADAQISSIHYIPVITTRFKLFCPLEHSLAGAKKITTEQLNQCNWVRLRHEAGEEEADDPLLCAIAPERVRFEVYSVSTAITLAKQNHCLLALPLQLEAEAKSRGLKVLDVAETLTTFVSGIMYIDDALKYAHKKAFIDTLIASRDQF